MTRKTSRYRGRDTRHPSARLCRPKHTGRRPITPGPQGYTAAHLPAPKVARARSHSNPIGAAAPRSSWLAGQPRCKARRWAPRPGPVAHAAKPGCRPLLSPSVWAAEDNPSCAQRRGIDIPPAPQDLSGRSQVGLGPRGTHRFSVAQQDPASAAAGLVPPEPETGSRTCPRPPDVLPIQELDSPSPGGLRIAAGFHRGRERTTSESRRPCSLATPPSCYVFNINVTLYSIIKYEEFINSCLLHLTLYTSCITFIWLFLEHTGVNFSIIIV
ncbi:hypothetical protein NDU88_004831 [Pleurodeles waltl]|uniref:Uncharacterized protein n=1 Tax=Pleurodeles waltl TaxID=8319 RepID=A0AAV7NKP2_PLEWA|nr:hypothetical protein NDU88_004831 [Pleurodeles waltl]